MYKPWRVKYVLVPVLLALGVPDPTVGWAKGERSTYTARLEHGVMRGVVKAARQAVLYAQVQGRVSEVPFKEGQRFKKGSTLVLLDCDKYGAELAAAAAEQEAKVKTVENNKELAKLHAISPLEFEISEADAKKAQAAFQIAEINVRSCHITAPFSGRVVGVMVNEHENVFPNDKLLSVLDDSSLEVELVLPSTALSWLKRQTRFTFSVDETRQRYPARVKEIGADVDAASQTVKVTGAFDVLPTGVLSGMSGSAEFMEHPKR
jgi:RND family efflux transporter MFP subunit